MSLEKLVDYILCRRVVQVSLRRALSQHAVKVERRMPFTPIGIANACTCERRRIDINSDFAC